MIRMIDIDKILSDSVKEELHELLSYIQKLHKKSTYEDLISTFKETMPKTKKESLDLLKQMMNLLYETNEITEQ